MKIEHNQRRRWCEEISSINQSINPSENKKEKSILEMRSTEEIRRSIR